MERWERVGFASLVGDDCDDERVDHDIDGAAEQAFYAVLPLEDEEDGKVDDGADARDEGGYDG